MQFVDPFDHLRVLDLSPDRIGAQVSQFFADFGADVIWVEPPGGSAMRREAAFPFWGRGKRSIVLDIDNEDDRDMVRRLAVGADVLIETSKPGQLDAVGLGYADLAAENPSLIYTSVTAFGRQGPYVDTPVDEDLVLAKLGVNHGFGRMSPYDDPPFVVAPFAAFSASQVALHGTLAALYERGDSGIGQRVETSLAQAFTTLDTWSWFEYLITQRWPGAYTPVDAFDEQGRPASPFAFALLVAQTADGSWLQFASVAPHLFMAMMKALDLEWMFTDERWQGAPLFDEADKRFDFWTHMLEAARKKTLAQWEQVFENDHDAFAEQFRNGPVALEHPQLVHDGMVADVEDAERGIVRQPGALVKAAATPARIDRSAPTLDEHRGEIMEEALSVGAATQSGARATPGEAANGLPLAGVTILELAVLFAAPHGTTMLTDLGARVIKVEQMSGDPIRTIIPFPESGGAKVMQGKESICVDLSTPEGLAIAHEIAKDVDVVVQGFRAGAVQRMQLDYETVKQLNPDVVYVNAPGYGVDGPYGDRPAYAPSIGAASGIPLANAGATAPERSDLTINQICDASRRLSAANASANAQADGFAALGVASTILFGLVARRAGAGGQELFSSMLNTGAHAMSAQAVTYPGAPPAPDAGDHLQGLGPLHRIYAASEGYVMLVADGDDVWEPLASALADQVDLRADERFADAAARAANAAALAETLADMFRSRPAAAWEADLLPQGIGCVALHTGTIEEKLGDEAFGRASGYVVDVVHPTFDEHPRLAPYIRFSRSVTQARPGVVAGQHTDALLAELGKTDEEIADLRQQEVVG